MSYLICICIHVYTIFCSCWKKNVVGHLSTDYSKTFPFYCSTLNPFSADALFLPMTRLSAISMRRSYLSFIVLRFVFLFWRGQMWSYHLVGFEYIRFHPLFFSKGENLYYFNDIWLCWNNCFNMIMNKWQYSYAFLKELFRIFPVQYLMRTSYFTEHILLILSFDNFR